MTGKDQARLTAVVDRWKATAMSLRNNSTSRGLTGEALLVAYAEADTYDAAAADIIELVLYPRASAAGDGR